MTLVMGILNVTPDSFSDGGRFADASAAVAHGLELAGAGADLIDVGGESTRPGAATVDPEEEQRRVLPVIEALAHRGVTVSVDTRNAGTARAAVGAGASVINDVSGGSHDEGMPRAAAETGATFVAVHARGPAGAPSDYDDVVREVRTELKARIAALVVAGVHPERIVIDPGLGFAKDAADNWALLRALPRLASLGHRMVVGASRKRFLGGLLPEGAAVEDRDEPTAIVSALSAAAGVWAVRVHDVSRTRLALDVVRSWHGEDPTP